jgi:hypothetical protein
MLQLDEEIAVKLQATERIATLRAYIEAEVCSCA